MNTVKRITKPKVVDFSKYANVETGQEMQEELIGEGVTVTANQATGMCTISSSDYAVIDSDALLALMQVLNNSDLANVIKMAVVTKTPLNVVFNGNVPHTNETLQKYLELRSEAMYITLIRRLIKVGVLYQIKGLIYGEVRVCYMLNPFLTRKRKQFESKVFEVFEQFERKQLNK